MRGHPFTVTLAASHDSADERQYVAFRGGVAKSLLDHEWKCPPSFAGVVAFAIDVPSEAPAVRARAVRYALAEEYGAKPESLLLLGLTPNLQRTPLTIIELTATRGLRYLSLLGALGDSDLLTPILLVRLMPTRAFVLSLAPRDEAYMALSALAARIDASRGRQTPAVREDLQQALQLRTEKIMEDLSTLAGGSCPSSADTSAISNASSDSSCHSSFAAERKYLCSLRSHVATHDVLSLSREVEDELSRRASTACPTEPVHSDVHSVLGAAIELQCFMAARMLFEAPDPALEQAAQRDIERLHCCSDPLYALIALQYTALTHVRGENLPEAALLAASLCSLAGGVVPFHTLDAQVLGASLAGMVALLYRTTTAMDLVTPTLLRCLALLNVVPSEVPFLPPSLATLIHWMMVDMPSGVMGDVAATIAGARTVPQSHHEEYAEFLTATVLSLVHC